MAKLWYRCEVQISPTNQLKRVSGRVPRSRSCDFSENSRGKELRNGCGVAVFSFAGPSAAQDFCGNEISMADNSLQITAKTASRVMWLPTPPAGLLHLVNASEH